MNNKDNGVRKGRYGGVCPGRTRTKTPKILLKKNKETLTSKRARTERFKEQTLIGETERSVYRKDQRV